MRHQPRRTDFPPSPQRLQSVTGLDQAFFRPQGSSDGRRRIFEYTILGSGSTGNAVFIDGPRGGLLLEAGLSRATLRRLLGARARRIGGILVSHEHTDHARSAAALARDLRVPVYGSHGTLQGIPGLTSPQVVLAPGQTQDVNGLAVTAFGVSHDSAEALGFRIDTDHGSLGYATDLGHVTPGVTKALTDCTDLIVESNHDPVLLRTGPYVASLQRRVAGPRGHLSNDASARLAASVASPGTRRLVLHHLSQTNNTPEFALAAHHAEMAKTRRPGPAILVAPPLGPFGPFPLGA